MLGIGDSLAGKLLMYDALAARTYVSEIKWDPENPLNGERPSIKRPVPPSPESYCAASGSSSTSPVFKSSGRGVEMMLYPEST